MKHIATIEFTEGASFVDIGLVLEDVIERCGPLETESNEDGSYNIYETNE